MNTLKYVALIVGLCVTLSASEKKQIQESFEVEPGKLVEFRTVSGMKVDVKSWDKSEVYIDLIVKVSCSDDEFEKEYIEKFNVDKRNLSRGIIIEFEEEDDDNGWSFWDIFRGKFYYSFSKEITGTIYVPQYNALQADFRYSDIELTDIEGEINLIGRSNDLYIFNCMMLNTIENDYGKNSISNCGGKLTLESRSSETEINTFNGQVRISADYATLNLKSISGRLGISTRSADVKINDVGSDLEMNADYSEITVNKVKGFVKISSRSGTIDVSNTEGLNIESPYTEIHAFEIDDKSGKDVKVLNQSGNISLEKVKGRVIIDDKYSDINLKDIEGHVILESRSSAITADNIKGNWKSDTKYSSVKVKDLRAEEVFIDNQSDDVKIRMTKTPKEVEIKNQYGGVEFSMPEGYKGSLDLFAQYGNIECNFPIRTRTEGSTSRANGRMGSENSTIIIETRSGDIEITENIH